ncbi:MAG: hypothetical protein HC933_14530 [Pleurocapsa sp. SU_196_0]|nr:hypothetical protein [Pleurocapsa sp. SU_196_0]
MEAGLMRSEHHDWAERIAKIIAEHQVLSRMKIKSRDSPSVWGQWLIAPVPSWLEGGFGPVPQADVEWIELNLVKSVFRGHRIPDSQLDVSETVLAALGAFCETVVFTRPVARVHPPAT